MRGSYFRRYTELCTNEESITQYNNNHHTRAHYLQKINNTYAKNTIAYSATPDSQGHRSSSQGYQRN